MNEEQLNLTSKLELPDSNQGSGGAPLYIGDVVTITVTLPKELATSTKPSFEETLKSGSLSWGDGRMLKHRSETTEGGDVVHRFDVSCYKPGLCKIPGVTFLSAEGKTIALTQAQELNYASVGNPEKEPELYGPMGVKLPLEVIIGVVMVTTLVAAVLSVVLWKIYNAANKKSLSKKHKTTVRQLTALEELVETYKNIGNKRYLDNSNFKKYYFSVSESLKVFVSRTCEFDAQEKTTSEIKAELARNDILDESTKKQWVELFTEMDVVKFTDYVPEVEAAQRLMEKSLALAQKTFASTAKIPETSSALETGVKR